MATVTCTEEEAAIAAKGMVDAIINGGGLGGGNGGGDGGGDKGGGGGGNDDDDDGDKGGTKKDEDEYEEGDEKKDGDVRRHNAFNRCSSLTTIKVHPWLWPKIFASTKNDPDFIHEILPAI